MASSTARSRWQFIARLVAVGAASLLAACGSEAGAPSQDSAAKTTADSVASATSTSSTTPSMTGDEPGANNGSATSDPADPTTPPLDCGEVLVRGCRGDGVERLQELLSQKGVAQLTADGDFGPITETALLAFETVCNVCVEDAQIQIDRDEWRALAELPDRPADDSGGSEDEAGAACFDCSGLPPGGVAAFLESNRGGGSAPTCDEFGGMPPPEELYAGTRRSVVELGTHEYFCLRNFRLDQPITVEILDPTGTRYSVVVNPDASRSDSDPAMHITGPRRTDVVNVVNSGGESGMVSDILWVVEPRLPVGRYQAQATQTWTEVDNEGQSVSFTQTSAPATFEVIADSVPRVEISLPQRRFGESYSYASYAPGDVLRFLFSGFPSQITVRPILYRHEPGNEDCGFWCFAAELDPIVVDGNGVATLQLPTDSAPAGLYCLTSVALQDCTSNEGFNGEFFLGDFFLY